MRAVYKQRLPQEMDDGVASALQRGLLKRSKLHRKPHLFPSCHALQLALRQGAIKVLQCLAVRHFARVVPSSPATSMHVP